MGSQVVDYISWPSSITESFDQSFDIHIEEVNTLKNPEIVLKHTDNSSMCYNHNIPKPPPPPPRKCFKAGLSKYCCVQKETKELWDKLFHLGLGADVHIMTDDGSVIAAHCNVLSIASPVLDNLLKQSEVKNGMRYLTISGLPYDALRAFVRFLYSSCYEEEEMKTYALHLLVLSHCYSVPSLKRVCVQFLEQGFLNAENVIDVLQLAINCDAPRLILICTRMVVRDFRSISSSEGWKVMRRANPSLEQELIESVVEVDTRKQERQKKMEEKRVYIQLHEAMEALLHICRDGCRTIGPRDKVLKGNQTSCSFQACKGLETLIRHFSNCKIRVPGGCVHCKRMWQLLELHSRMCSDPDYCKVPLCQHFKVKMRHQTKKDEAKWKLLVSKVMAAKNAQRLFSSHRSSF